MKIKRDGQDQPLVEWRPGNSGTVMKRAWIQNRQGAADWAGTGRYLNIGNFNNGVSQGHPQDFPILDPTLSDEQVLYGAPSMLAALAGVIL